jgi:hypothetical protein
MLYNIVYGFTWGMYQDLFSMVRIQSLTCTQDRCHGFYQLRSFHYAAVAKEWHLRP